ncbi:hypothetical protein JHK85_054307 [Glycine max]|nr:hypothetical protein JHK85_054307 [Glycine max]
MKMKLEDPIFPGCGVFMQDKDPNFLGYYQPRKVKMEEFSDEVDDGFDDDDDDEKLELDGFTPAGVGYGNITEEYLERVKKKKVTKAEKKRMAKEADKEKEEVTVCARCHCLRNYGQVKNQTLENLIPDFDFDSADEPFWKTAVKSLFQALERIQDNSKRAKKLPKIVLVATKVDLLPSQVSPASSKKDLGVRNLLSFVKDLAGPRGNVWVIGAQNAGKSTLINAFAKKQGAKVTKLTEAPIPGTTLGILRIAGVLPAKTKMFDTPGLLHPYLMSMRLNRDEQKMVEIRKELRPRTYRIKARQAIQIGGLTRLDLVEASVETIYVIVWASANVSLHMGKIENADEVSRNHVGVSLAFDGVEVTLREPLVLDRAPSLEKPGFWLPKAISDAIGNQTKLEAQRRKQQLEDEGTEYVGAGAGAKLSA